MLRDITQILAPDTPMWPGDTPFSAARTWHYGPDCPVNVSRFESSTHAGTHADSPLHYDPNGAPIEAVDLNAYLGRARVIDVRGAGVVAVDLNGCDADLAVGCGYKYLNGGPGAPAFLYVARRLLGELTSPLSGWMGHAAPFAFEDDYRPAPGIDRFLCGTPSPIAMAALEAGLATFDGVDRGALFAKGRALGDYCIELMAVRCGGRGFTLESSPDGHARGSHVSFSHPNAWPLCQALIARGVIGDFRAPDALRLGFAPLYTGFADVWHAVDALRDIIDSGGWDNPLYHARAAVT